jgi:hypothetical protein
MAPLCQGNHLFRKAVVDMRHQASFPLFELLDGAMFASPLQFFPDAEVSIGIFTGPSKAQLRVTQVFPWGKPFRRTVSHEGKSGTCHSYNSFILTTLNFSFR